MKRRVVEEGFDFNSLFLKFCKFPLVFAKFQVYFQVCDL